MIISCEKCETKYRLASSMISSASVKVQCSKCDHIFIVPATGKERKKREHHVDAPPHEKNDTQGEEKPPADETGPGPEQGETRAEEPLESPPEPEAPADEEDNERYPAEEEGRDAGDLSFKAEGDEPQPPQSETALRDREEEPRGEESGPAEKPVAGPETGEADADESADEAPAAAPESEGSAKEETKEAPLPWEVSANTFDLSFGTKEDKPGDEAETGDVEKKSAVEKDPAFYDISEKAEKPQGNEGQGGVDGEGEDGEDVGRLLERTDASFDVKELLEKADEGLGTPEKASEEAPSFSEELLKAVSNVEKALDETGQGGKTIAKEEAKAEPNHTFVRPDTPAEPEPEPEPEETKKSSIAAIIAIIVIVLAISGSLLYLKTKPDSTLMAEPSGERPIEIESTKGYYVVNKSGGKIFVIETMIKNVTDGPVKISGIRGLVMDSSGGEMARKMVSPGRIVTAEDLRNLPVETLLKSFSDTSAGTMPKKATIPTMILFTDLQKAVAQYGIDVLR